jgi:O-antigen ligase
MALRMARNRPLLGVGPDNFRWVYGDFAEIPRWDTGVHANNVYMEWLADTGVLGLGAFAWFSIQLGRSLYLWERAGGEGSKSRLMPVWQLALAVALASWFLHGLADYFYGPLTTNVGFWLVAGLAVSGDQRARADSQ